MTAERAAGPDVASTADRHAGCLVGQALGDAFGFVVEGQDGSRCRRYAEHVVQGRRATGWARRPFTTGQYSDDTQLARELAASLVDRGGFDPEDYARRIAAIFVEGRIVGRGASTEAAAFRLAAGMPWDRAGTPPPSAGNGSAMRVAPLGLRHAHDLPALRRAADDQGRITHADPRCVAGSRVIARAVAAALRDELDDAPALCEELAVWAEDVDPILADALRALPRWLPREPVEAEVLIAPVGLDVPSQWWGISPFVTPSVLWSLYAALRHRDDYLAAIATAIAVGGDVDTTAAMTGAIVGARVGLAGLPSELAVLVHDRQAHGHDALVALAHALAASG